MKIQKLPIFNELIRILCDYDIESWAIHDFWSKIRFYKIVDHEMNYQEFYRVIFRLVKEGYLTIEPEEHTYTQSIKLISMRSDLGKKNNILQLFIIEKDRINIEIFNIEEEMIELENLKYLFIEAQSKIEQLQQINIERIYTLKVKLRALNSLIQYFK